MPGDLYFSYGTTETDYLKAQDSKLGAAIERIGHIKRPVNPDIYASLVRSVVGQQISTKAQATVWGRMRERFQPFTPQAVGAVSAAELQACGISMRKAVYIKEMTQAVLNKEIDLLALEDMPDDEVCRELTKLRGIGIWTAEMLLTFSLQRPDVVSYSDLAIRRGLRMLYGHKKLTRPGNSASGTSQKAGVSAFYGHKAFLSLF
ncbi:MAG TPA: DNA-3-methyladenine glycosylase 2 family protein [Firmicutes bacterium]|nr:DNA-3-methyladenine glycosylase 2 family protein [Bacillota bacterium]